MILTPETVQVISIGDRVMLADPSTDSFVEVFVEPGFGDTIFLTTVDSKTNEPTLTEDNYKDFIKHLRRYDDVAAMTREQMAVVLASKEYTIE
jgi:hypothetical protein